MRLSVLVLLALAFPGVSLGATGQAAGKVVNPGLAGNSSSTVVTATGSSTSRSLKDRFADVVNVKDFGAKGDCATDDTAAIQAAINAAGATGGEVYLPALPLTKCYKFARIFFQYDAVNNPGFPSGSTQGRGITFRGAGPGSDTGAQSTWGKSTLVSTSATGPALVVDGTGGFSARQVVIEGISVVATSTGAVIRMKDANTGSAIRRVNVVQNGCTGGGIDWDSPWVAGIRDVIVQSGCSVTSAGSYGIRMRPGTSGGQVVIENATVMKAYGVGTPGATDDTAGGFETAYQIGGVVGDGGSYETEAIVAFECRLCTAQQAKRGFLIGRLRTATFTAPYTEQLREYAMKFTNRASWVTVSGGYFADSVTATGEVVIDSALVNAPIDNLVISGNWFSQIKNYGINFLDPTYTTGRIANNRFTRDAAGAGTGVAIKTGGLQTPWTFEDNIYDPFNGGGITAYDSTTGIRRRCESDATYATAGGNCYQNERAVAKAFEASVSHDFASIPANSSVDYQFTVTGARPGDAVAVGVDSPGGTPYLADGLVLTAHVRFFDTVRIRIANITTGAIDPPNLTFNVKVFK